MNHRRLIAILVFGALVLGAAYWFFVPTTYHENGTTDAAEASESDFPTFKAAAMPIDRELRRLQPSGHALRFVLADDDAHMGPVEATVGMAGIFPPPTRRAGSDGLIGLPEPQASTLWGDEVRRYEVFARTDDNTHAFWGEISTEEIDKDVVVEARLTEASPLEVMVRDEAGEPVDGAEVRVSRGFIGLVHRTKTTGADGTVVFDALPAGEFRVTLQADGFARRMRRLSHGADPEPIEIALQRGPTRIGNGELERLAAQVVVPGNRTVVPTASDENVDEQQEGAERTPSDVDLFVVDSTGSAVSGALVQLWQDGRKLFEQTSNGTTPVRVELTAPFSGTLVAFDGRRGEGRLNLSLSPGETGREAIVRLDKPLFSLGLPPGRITSRSRIEQVLGAELVRDNDAWLADVLSPTSAAAEAGIERGARVVWLRETGGGYEALVEQGGQRMRVQVPSK